MADTEGHFVNLWENENWNILRTSADFYVRWKNYFIITLRAEIFAEQIFAELIFAILALNREIKFRKTH